MKEARAVAVGPEDHVYVAGDEVIRVFDSLGTPLREIALPGQPTCLAVGGAGHAYPGRIYAGVGRNIEVFDAEGNAVATCDTPGEKVHPTSIALATSDVFVADSANRVVLRYSGAGKLIREIGKRDPARGVRGFVIPSPFFDVATAGDVLWVVHPGARRLEAYTFDGLLDRYWGESSTAPEGFFGCCNPAHFALLPDGSFVTAEKGLLRVKVYTADGQFDCVVAGPEQLEAPGTGASPRTASRFDHEYDAVDVAADSRGRVLVLDLARANVRVFERKEPPSAKGDTGEDSDATSS
jgi:hypothetical protein